MSAALDHMVRRVESDPAFLACQLAAYRTLSQWTDADLAAWLRVDAATLTRIKLCQSCHEAAHVAQVAAVFGCDAGRLAAACGIPGDAE